MHYLPYGPQLADKIVAKYLIKMTMSPMRESQSLFRCARDSNDTTIIFSLIFVFSFCLSIYRFATSLHTTILHH